MGWLSGWDQRVKLTIDQGDIDAALSDFPVLIYLSTSSGRGPDDVSFVFDELLNDGNRKKITVTKSDGTTECYVEIEKWDHAGEEAWLWVKVPDVASGADTDLYLYYDVDHADNDAYVGDPSDAVAHNVWDGDFELVTHMRDDPDTSHVRDSTVNANDGTKKAATEPAVTISGKIDDAQDFADDEQYINFGDIAELDGLAEITIESWVNTDVLAGGSDLRTIIAKVDFDSPGPQGWEVRLITTIDVLEVYVGDVTEFWVGPARTGVILASTWYHVVAVYDKSLPVASQLKIYLDGSHVGSADGHSLNIKPTAGEVWIGSAYSRPAWCWDGKIDEVRVSVVARTAAWIKASYESGRDHLIDFGAEEAAIVKIMSSTVQATEELLRRGRSIRSKPSTVQLAETLPRRMWSIRLLAEALSVPEGIVRRMRSVRLMASTIEITEILVRRMRLIREMVSTVNLSEALIRRARGIYLISETVTLAEAFVRIPGFVRMMAETVALVETGVQRFYSVRTMDSTVVVIESWVRRNRMVRFISETLGLIERWFSSVLLELQFVELESHITLSVSTVSSICIDLDELSHITKEVELESSIVYD